MYKLCCVADNGEMEAYMSKVAIRKIEVEGMTYTVREAGMDNKGELVILLHGFPECSIIWEKTMEKLSAMGYRCLAPDQRGYSEGARPGFHRIQQPQQRAGYTLSVNPSAPM